MPSIEPTKKFVIALFLCIAAGSVFAQTGWSRDQDREQPKKRQQTKELRREEVRAAQHGQAPKQKREASSQKGQKRKADAQNERRSQKYDQQGSHPRNNGRMSPEERRALRRQINEANKSITYHHTGHGYP